MNAVPVSNRRFVLGSPFLRALATVADDDIRGVSPDPQPLRTKRRMPRLAALAAVAISALTIASTEAVVEAPAAHATCNNHYCGDLPEWYQFCKERTPGGTFSDRTQYVYKGAPASSSGVDCQYDYAAFGGFVPRTKVVHYSWPQVCNALRIGKHATWDGHYPHCKP